MRPHLLLSPSIVALFTLGAGGCGLILGLNDYTDETQGACKPGESESCYSGPDGTETRGICHAGTRTCKEDGSGFGECLGEQTPLPREDCSNGKDDDCNGKIDDCSCDPGKESACYTGPDQTEGVGNCHGGMHVCLPNGMGFGACDGEQKPEPEDCEKQGNEACDGKPCSDAVWAYELGDTGHAYAAAIRADAAGNTYALGHFLGQLTFPGRAPATATGGGSLFLARLDAKGKFDWVRTFVQDQGAAVDLVVTPEGTATLVATGSGNADFEGHAIPVNNGTWLVQFDTHGNYTWGTSFDGVVATGAGVTGDGDVILTGAFRGTFLGMSSPSAATDFVARLSGQAGAKVWSHPFGNGQDQNGGRVGIGKNDRVVVSGALKGSLDFGGGAMSGAAFVAGFDADGTPAWSHALPATDSGPFIQDVGSSATGTTVLVGQMAGALTLGSQTVTSAGGGNQTSALLLAYDDSGDLVWGKTFGSVADAERVGVDQHDIVVAGWFEQTINFGGSNLIDDGPNGAIFLAKLDLDGHHRWSKRLTDNEGSDVYGLALGSDRRIRFANDAYQSEDLGTGPLPFGGAEDALLACFFP